MFHENLTSGNSITVGSSTDQVSCPVLHVTSGELWVSGKFRDDYDVGTLLMFAVKKENFCCK